MTRAAVRKLALAASVCLAVGVSSAPAEIGAENFSAVVTLTSDYVFRGISQSEEEPAIQGGFDFEHGVGLFAGVWASSVRFPSRPEAESSRQVELDYYLGYRTAVGPDWSAGVMVTRYTYPGSRPKAHYDYGEIELSAAFRDLVAGSVSYTDDVYGFGQHGVAYEVSTRYPVSDHLEVDAGVGAFDVEGPLGGRWLYWGLGLVRHVGAFSFRAGYIDTDAAAERLWGDRLTAGRLVVSVTAVIP